MKATQRILHSFKSTGPIFEGVNDRKRSTALLVRNAPKFFWKTIFFRKKITQLAAMKLLATKLTSFYYKQHLERIDCGALIQSLLPRFITSRRKPVNLADF